MEIVVFGAGSLGSLIGGLLSRVHDVTLVGRRPHMDRVAEDGLRIGGLIDERVHPTARTEATGLASDLALVTVKSYDTRVAAEALETGDHDAVCSLQNGLGNEEVLAEVLDAPVLGATVTYGADLVAPGEVLMTGRGEFTVGLFRGGDAALLDAVIEALGVADIAVSDTDDIRTQLWRKLAINAAINPVTALTRRRNGAVTERPLLGVATAAAKEVELVAAVNDVDLVGPQVISQVREVAAATAENRSSMLRDVLEERRTEIDAINGAVVDRAGVAEVPVNEALAALIRGWERGLELR
ncbi:MAG: ketopantoate reductase family protein [Halobacteriota archaeon]